MTAYERGQLAYDAYAAEVGGVSAVTGDPLPAFADTGELVQSGWIAAAAAVVADVSNAAAAPVPRETGDERG
jgi:hypothetical protein